MQRLPRPRPECRRRAIVTSAALTLIFLCAPGAVSAVADEDAGIFLTDLTDRAVAQLTEPGLGEDEQKKRFRRLLVEAFDLPGIGRFVLGRYWRHADAAQRREFLAAFEDVMLFRFGPMLSQYSGEKFEVGTIRPFRNNPEFISVKSMLRRTEGEAIQVDWRMRKHDGGYKIVDIVAEGVSIAVTMRSEFVSVLKRNNGDVDALTQDLRRKAKGL